MKKSVLLLFLFLFSNFCLAQWQTNGPYGGVTQCLTVNGSNIYVGTLASGIFVSTDGGSNWNACNNGISNLNIYSLASTGSTVFAGTYGSGPYKTTNNGANWVPVNTGISTAQVWSLAFSGTNLFAGTYGGVYI